DPPVHRGPAVGGPDPRPDRQARAHHPPGRHPQPHQPALGLRLPHALPDRDEGVGRGRAAPRGGLARPLQGLHPPPLRRRDTVPRSPARPPEPPRALSSPPPSPRHPPPTRSTPPSTTPARQRAAPAGPCEAASSSCPRRPTGRPTWTRC